MDRIAANNAVFAAPWSAAPRPRFTGSKLPTIPAAGPRWPALGEYQQGTATIECAVKVIGNLAMCDNKPIILNAEERDAITRVLLSALMRQQARRLTGKERPT